MSRLASTLVLALLSSACTGKLEDEVSASTGVAASTTQHPVGTTATSSTSGLATTTTGPTTTMGTMGAQTTVGATTTSAGTSTSTTSGVGTGTETGGEHIPCMSGSNNHVTEDGQQCECNAGFEWCSDDINDLNCCAIDSDETDTSDTQDDLSCDVDGTLFCTNDAAMGPTDSRLWECRDGQWTDITAELEGACQENGWDFAFGCIDDPTTQSISILCGEGPGTPCVQDELVPRCHDPLTLEFCLDGRLTHDPCHLEQGKPGCIADGTVFETGECSIVGERAYCVCFDTDGSREAARANRTRMPAAISWSPRSSASVRRR